jgi:L-asparaginase
MGSMRKKPKVVVLGTGGTIAGAGSSATNVTGYQPSVIGVADLVGAVPRLGEVAELEAQQLFQVASYLLETPHWLKMARAANEALARDDVSGVVITHGTDTLEETAYFLHLAVRSEKPVVVTGALRPATALSADGPMNLFNAVSLAASADAVGKGVLVALNDRIACPRDVTKTHTSGLETFRSPEYGNLGQMENGVPRFYRAPLRRHTVHTEFSFAALDELPRVEIVMGYVGATGAPIAAAVADGASGIVYAGTGAGNFTVAAREALVAARRSGAVVVRASRIAAGVVTRNTGHVDDDALDFVVADDLSPQKARILLMLGLTRTRDTRELQRMFRTY